MLGRRILESFPVEDTLDAKPLGLSVRKLKPIGLCIRTQASPIEPSENRMNRMPPQDVRVSEFSAVLTPNTSHTFGYPYPAVPAKPQSPQIQSNSTPTAPDVLRTRRTSRYIHAEQALEATFNLCSSETSPQELQIRALEQAAAALGAHVHDAQERAAELRARLADRELKPDDYRSLQRERWLEERRCTARDHESKALRETLLTLQHDRHLHHELQDNLAPNLQSRRMANLARFFERSSTRTPFPLHAISASYTDLYMRRKTISDVHPLQLRPPALATTLSLSPQIRRRPVSFDVHRAVAVSPQKVEPSPTLSVPAALMSSSASLMETPHAELSYPTRPASPMTRNGVATIYAGAVPRSKEELLTELSDVGLPQYALNLLEELSSVHEDVSLSIRSPELSSKHVSSTTPAPRSKEVSRTLSSARSHPDFTRSMDTSSRTLPSRSSLYNRPIMRRPFSSLFSAQESASNGLQAPSSVAVEQEQDMESLRSQTPSPHLAKQHRISVPSNGRASFTARIRSRLSILSQK